MMGCYGDTYAKTPNFDALAAAGIRYTNAHSVAPVCSVSRSSIVTGMYPSTIGTLHHRSGGIPAPAFLQFVPNLMREAGYWTSNKKGDFNIVGMKYDKQGKKGGDMPWRSRPDKNQPFFSKIDFSECHSSVTKTSEAVIVQKRLNRLQPGDFHNPDHAPIPSYHPDDPVFRTAWARYYDAVTQVDYRAGEVIAALKADGLWEDTIVIVWADHGVGMPRGKHTVWEQGTHVPLIVRFPDKYQHLAPAKPGTALDDLICLMDLAPSVLTLGGINPPDYMQGRALLCKSNAEKRTFLVAMRNRLDTRTQFARAVRDKRYRYMRHFFPHRPYAPYETFQWEAPIYDRFRELALAGKLEGPQAEYAQRFKAVELLYDSEKDPEMVHNLAGDSAYADVLKTMRQRLRDWMIETRDLGLIEERELYERADGGSLWQVGQKIDNYARILETANLQLAGKSAVPKLLVRLKDNDSQVRYWATLGLVVITQTAEAATVTKILPHLHEALSDASIDVRLVAAEGLFNLGDYEQALPVVLKEMDHPNTDVQVRVGNILDSQPPDANKHLQAAVKPLSVAMKKFKPQARYGSANKPLERAYRALTNQQLYYRWGVGASGSPISPLMAVQKTPFANEEKPPPRTANPPRPKPGIAAKRPNIIFIMADDLGYADLGCYGAKKIQTPHIDRLARDGIRFTNGYTGASTCTPTRYSFLTGRYNFRSWCTHSALSTTAPLLIEPERVTIASLLKSHGYNTAMIGKWHLGYGLEPGFAENRGNQPPNYWETRGKGPNWNGILSPGPASNGFDYAYVIPVANSFPPYVMVENDRVEGLRPDSPIGKLQSKNYGKMEGGKGARWTDEELIDKFAAKLTSKIRDFTRENKPFFLAYTPSHPHIGSRNVRGQAHWPHERFAGTSEAGPFGDTIHELDWSVGELLKTLDELGIADNTLVIFTSDNGGYSRSFNGHQPNGSMLRGGKGDLSEGGIRSPFLARWPGKIPAGTVSEEIVSTTDMMATFAAIIGASLPQGAGPDSYNVLPALLGKELPDPERPVVFVSGGTGKLALRAGKWKLMDGQGRCGYGEMRQKKPWPTPKPSDPPAQLYNLDEDPGEANNLYRQHPGIVHRLKTGLEKIRADENYNPTHLEKPKETLSIGELDTLFATSSAGPGIMSPPERKPGSPNVLFILVDDLGWRDLGCYGHPLHETPNIDALAGRSMRFTNAYAACPICAPSRAAIMTGKFPYNTGFVDNYKSVTQGDVLQRTEERQYLDLKERTLAEAFKAGGYQTGFLGKWHLSASDEIRLPTDQGFEVNIAGGWKGHPHHGFFSPYNLAHLNNGPKGEYLPDRLTTEAIGLMDSFSRRDPPWFVFMSYYTVHSPFHSKPEKTKKYVAKAKASKVNLKNPAYAGMVESLDENVGRLLAWLDEKGLRENTIVVFTSDNGGMVRATENRPLRSYKGDLYEGGIRVPCMIDWPGVIDPGSVSDTPVHGVDFYTTLLTMTGLPPQSGHPADSVNLVPLLKGATDFKRGPMAWHYPIGVPHIAHSHPGSVIRDGDWKLLRFYKDGREELYNLKTDIGETRNLIVSMPEKARALKVKLDALLKTHDAEIPVAVPAKPAAKKKRAKAK